MAATVTQNVRGEPVGAINRAFVGVDRVFDWGKRQKRSNRKRYNAVKKTIVALGVLGPLTSIIA